MTRSLFLAAASLAIAPLPAIAKDQAPSAAIAAAVASSDRPAEDKARDVHRKPGEMLAFAGVKPGDKVADLLPGGGYFTRVFSKAVGPGGKVYAAIPAALLASRPNADAPIKAIAAEPAFANVTETKLDDSGIGAPEPLDIAFTAQNYHDILGRQGAEGAAKWDAAVFKALKPGGTYIVIDHAASAGAADAPTKLHRIDPAVVKAQVTKAGFEFVGESDAIRNPADAHDKPVFDASIRGATDQFVYKFRKPR